MPLKLPPQAPAYLREFAAVMNSQMLRREPIVVGTRTDGVNLYVRFLAAYAAPWVQVHIQTDQAGEGGTSYNSSNYKSSTLVDCREDLLQEISTPDITPGNYYIWLIPVQYDGSDKKVLYDGEGGNPDNMVFVEKPAILSEASTAVWLDISENDFDDATYLYYGGLDYLGAWQINRYPYADLADRDEATIANNSSYSTLAAAWAARSSLTYV